MILAVDYVTPELDGFLKDDKAQLRETLRISSREYPFSCTILASEGAVLFVNFQKNISGILIENEEISKTIISLHKAVWDRGR